MSKLTRQDCFVCSTNTYTEEEACIGPGYKEYIRFAHFPWAVEAFMISIISATEAIYLNGLGLLMHGIPNLYALLYLQDMFQCVLFPHQCPCPLYAIPNPQPPLMKLFLSKPRVLESFGGCFAYWSCACWCVLLLRVLNKGI